MIGTNQTTKRTMSNPQTITLVRHKWGPSRVGHGEAQCVYCLMTNREAWVLGNFCLARGPVLIVHNPSSPSPQWRETINDDQP